MTIESIARQDVVSLDETRNARDAARAMRDRHVGSVVVTRGEGRAVRLVGIVTDRDIAMALAVDGQDAFVALGQLAQRPLLTIPRQASVAEAASAMRCAGVRRLVLVDEHRHMVGIVSLDDLLGAADELLGSLVEAMRFRRELEPAISAPQDGQGAPLLVSPELAAIWAHVVRT
jgi:CBS domain-containing protein